MVRSLKKLGPLVLLIALLLPLNQASAATSKPAPKATNSTTNKPVVKPTTKSTFKASLTNKTPVAKKKVVPKKRIVRKKVQVTPSPSPKWPPPNFSHSGTIYAKVPTAEELKGAASNSLSLTADLKICEIHTCGAVSVASESGCNYWEVDSVISKISADDPKVKTPLGSLRTLTYGSKAKQILTILLISDQPLTDGVSAGGITAKCWNTSPGGKVPSNTYTPVATND